MGVLRLNFRVLYVGADAAEWKIPMSGWKITDNLTRLLPGMEISGFIKDA